MSYVNTCNCCLKNKPERDLVIFKPARTEWRATVCRSCAKILAKRMLKELGYEYRTRPLWTSGQAADPRGTRAVGGNAG